MGSALLSAFQPAFIADGIHHDLAFLCKEVGGQNEQDKHDNHKPAFDHPVTLVQFECAENECCDEQGAQQQHNAGITEAVERLKEVHVAPPILESKNSMTLGEPQDKSQA